MSLSSSKELEVKSTAKPNWLQLPTDVTADILFRLDTYEIMKNVRNVCPLWWKICKNPIMWQTIYMGNFDRVCLPQYQILELGMKLPLLEELNISITVWNGYCLPIKLKTFHQLPSEITDKCNADPFWTSNVPGLLAILDGCPRLESLNLSGCFNLKFSENLEKRCREQIKELVLVPDASELYDICWSENCEYCGMSSEDEDSSYHSCDSEF
ncbi:F-box/LRR protein, putative [Medicago truncatula]|uniref:F-box/LRR protein, putative n=1 Tax=Medicago truncatula TaxID=3880 RepID=G7IXB0_MEDTR|nr:F-box/LRR protein, putative [Medicago truncatula]